MAIHNHVEADVAADLYNTIPGDGSAVTLMGNTTRGDINPLFYLYDQNATDADNYPLVIKPTLQTGSGRWILKMPQQVQADWSEATTSALGYIKNKPSIPAAQIQSDWNQSNTASADFIKNKPSLPSAPSQGVVSRSLNTSFQPAASDPLMAYYSITIAVSSTLLGTNSGTIALQISADNVTFTTIAQIALSVAGVTSTVVDTKALSGFVPAGYYVKLVTSQTGSNGATMTYVTGQEVTL